MSKFRILSDLHLEFYDCWKIPSGRNDIGPRFFFDEETLEKDFNDECLILAGDIVTFGTKERFRAFFDLISEKFKKVVIIAGNHEWYKSDFIELQSLKQFYELNWYNFKFLENESTEFEGIPIHGCTLWADYRGGNPSSMFHVGGFPDFMHIKDKGRHISPQWQRDRYEESFAFLNSAIENQERSGIIVTHHAPSHRAVAPQFKGSIYNDFFLNDLDNWIEENTDKIKLWVNGHIHNSTDFLIGDTRIISNPFGYDRGQENFYGFSKNKTIDIL